MENSCRLGCDRGFGDSVDRRRRVNVETCDTMRPPFLNRTCSRSPSQPSLPYVSRCSRVVRAVDRRPRRRRGTTATTGDVVLLRHRVRHRVVRLLERLHVQLGFVLPRDVPSDGVVPRERPRAERTRHPDALVTLPYVGAQVRLVAVQSLAERTLQLLTIGSGDGASLVDLRVPHSGGGGRRTQIRGRRMSGW